MLHHDLAEEVPDEMTAIIVPFFEAVQPFAAVTENIPVRAQQFAQKDCVLMLSLM